MVDSSKSPAGKVTIKIPRPLYNKISVVIEDAGYNSVTDFVVYIMRDLVASHELAGTKADHPEQLEKVKRKLKALGYL